MRELSVKRSQDFSCYYKIPMKTAHFFVLKSEELKSVEMINEAILRSHIGNLITLRGERNIQAQKILFYGAHKFE
jgi:hypothetical protein